MTSKHEDMNRSKEGLYENASSDIERFLPSESKLLATRKTQDSTFKKCEKLFDTYYSNENLAEYKPFDVLLTTNYVEEGLCRFKYMDDGVTLYYGECDVDMRTRFLPSQNICLKEVSGKKKFLDIEIACENIGERFQSKVLFRNIHVCGGPGCGTITLGSVLEDIFQENTNTVSNDCQVSVYSSKEGKKCDELPKDKFIMKDESGKKVKNTCEWLMKLDQDGKRDICSQMLKNKNGDKPARIVCPTTCCTCDENPTTNFLKMRVPNESDPTKEWTAVAKNCNWLQKQPIDQVNKYCDKRIALDKLLPAVSMCPETCESCPYAKPSTNSTGINRVGLLDEGNVDPFRLFTGKKG